MNQKEIRALVEEKEPQLVALIDSVKAAGGRLVALQVGDHKVGSIDSFWNTWEQAVVPEYVPKRGSYRAHQQEQSRQVAEDREALRKGTRTRRRSDAGVR